MNYTIFSCASADDIQIERRYATVVKKEWRQLGDQSVMWQYWQDNKWRDVTYSERLETGDTGYYIGFRAAVFVKR